MIPLGVKQIMISSNCLDLSIVCAFLSAVDEVTTKDLSVILRKAVSMKPLHDSMNQKPFVGTSELLGSWIVVATQARSDRTKEEF